MPSLDEATSTQSRCRQEGTEALPKGEGAACGMVQGGDGNSGRRRVVLICMRGVVLSGLRGGGGGREVVT